MHLAECMPPLVTHYRGGKHLWTWLLQDRPCKENWGYFVSTCCPIQQTEGSATESNKCKYT